MAYLLQEAVSFAKEEKWADCQQVASEAAEIAWEALHRYKTILPFMSSVGRAPPCLVITESPYLYTLAFLFSSSAWADVSPTVRRAYAMTQIYMSAYFLHQRNVKQALERLDMVLLMGSPDLHNRVNSLITDIQSKLPEQKGQVEKRRAPSPSGDLPISAKEGTKRPKVVDLNEEIPRVHCPSLNNFLAEYMQKSVPVILTGCMDAWPASGKLEEYKDRAWSNLEYVKSVAGLRTVPVEVGKGNYLNDDEWGQKLMTISEFIDRHIGKEGEAVGYLAQHQLFDQIPSLRRDILTPDYCALGVDEEEEEEGDDVIMNAWFGPGGTVSPLHHDPYHNLLAQVVGSKRVMLYPPSDSLYLYPYEGKMYNNSQVSRLFLLRTSYI